VSAARVVDRVDPIEVVEVVVGQHLVVVLRVHQRSEGKLLEVAQAACLARLFPRLGEDGKQDRREDRDDLTAEKGLEVRDSRKGIWRLR